MWELTVALAFTTHLGLVGDYNEVHPHVRLNNGPYIIGLFYNSEERVSPYAGYRFEYDEVFAELGLTGGYKSAPVLPFIRVGYDFNDNLTAFITPAYEQPDTIGAVFGIEVKF